MDIPEKVVTFLNRNAGRSFCDACIGQECAAVSSRDVEQVTATLALTADYERAECECGRCGLSERLATRAI